MKMRSALTTVMLLLTLIAVAGNEDSLYCLNIKGEFENAYFYNNDPCMVEIMADDGEVDTVYLYRFARKLKCSLKRDKEYCIKVSKPGFAPMFLCVDTRIDKKDRKLYWFVFSTRLIIEKRARTLNKEKLQMPMAHIKFDPKKKGFAHDEEYTCALQRDLVLQSGIW